jgi:hypothetical protein
VTIPIKLILYIIYISPWSLPISPLPTLLKAIARGILVLFHLGIWSPSTIYSYVISFLTSTHMVCILESWFLLQYLSWCSKRCLNLCPLWVCFTLVCSTPFITLLYSFTSQPPFFNSFQYTSLYTLPSHLMVCDITDALTFSFLFPLSLSSVE